METQKDFKVLWSSNSSHSPTGYGTVTNNICYGLYQQGVNIRVACNYGLEGASLGLNGVIHYPRLFAEIGEDALKIIMDGWQPDLFITLYDVWVGGKAKHAGIDSIFKSLHPRWIAYVPVDHYPIPDAVAEQSRQAYKVVSMSQFGQKEFERVNIPSRLIPHGVDTTVFKPTDKLTAKKYMVEHITAYDKNNHAPLDPENFVVGINASNKDPYRKDWGRMFTAFQIFLEQNPDAKKDARLHTHTWRQFPNGFNLDHLAQKLNIQKYLTSPLKYDMFCAYPAERLATMYNSCDIFMNLARGEGFGIPIIEAQACAVPVIATNYSAMTELVDGHGWLIPLYADEVECPDCHKQFSYHGGMKQFGYMASLYGVPDEFKTADIIEKAYNSPDLVKKLGKKSAEFAQDYDYKTKILPLWMDLLDEVKSEMGMFGKCETKDNAFNDLFKEAMAQ